jgi:hypothetical protein
LRRADSQLNGPRATLGDRPTLAAPGCRACGYRGNSPPAATEWRYASDVEAGAFNGRSRARTERRAAAARRQSTWPKGIRSISYDEADALGVDAKGELYWHGKPVEIRRPLDLTWWQNAIAIIVAIATVLAALGAVAQGFAAYNEWACKVGWRSVACPAPAQPAL